MLYRVCWEIDVEADSPEEAAHQARAAQTRRGTTATVFDVYTRGRRTLPVRIDTNQTYDYKVEIEWNAPNPVINTSAFSRFYTVRAPTPAAARARALARAALDKTPWPPGFFASTPCHVTRIQRSPKGPES